jgi:putative flippase GtrA
MAVEDGLIGPLSVVLLDPRAVAVRFFRFAACGVLTVLIHYVIRLTTGKKVSYRVS